MNLNFIYNPRMQLHPFSKILIGLGISFILIGLAWQFFGKYIPLGKLPGDIHFQSKKASFHFPIVTCLLISALLSLTSYLFNRFK